MSSRPNILWIGTDEQHRQTVGAYGSPIWPPTGWFSTTRSRRWPSAHLPEPPCSPGSRRAREVSSPTTTWDSLSRSWTQPANACRKRPAGEARSPASPAARVTRFTEGLVDCQSGDCQSRRTFERPACRSSVAPRLCQPTCPPGATVSPPIPPASL